MTFTPTDEQLAIREAAVSTSDNLLVRALAGAAKTSTLVLLAEALPDTRILCLAFNKKIATEMQERLPQNCTAMTLNSIGYRAWREIVKSTRIDKDKMHTIFTSLVDALPPTEKTLIYDNFTEYMKTLSLAKQSGYVPDGYGRGAKPLMSDDDFWGHTEQVYDDWERELLTQALTISLNEAWDGNLDFDDQVLMPVVFYAPFPRYPLVLIDEAQDLSSLNHAMLRKLVVKRLIAVGDECQAIYGFRGAHQNSMNLLRETFSMQEYTLSISFRCPRSVVKHARWRAPHMQYPEWAIEGEVSTLATWAIEDLPENCVILCRNNAPLFSLALKMLLAGRYAEIMGNDIGKGLIKVMKKFGSLKLPQAQLLDAIQNWETEKASKTRYPGPIHDRAACMRIFAQQADDLGGAIAYAESIFNASGPIKLSTGHKAKGLEFPIVYILNKQLLGKEGQDPNLLYVMQTRAQESLTYIDMEGLEDGYGDDAGRHDHTNPTQPG